MHVIRSHWLAQQRQDTWTCTKIEQTRGLRNVVWGQDELADNAGDPDSLGEWLCLSSRNSRLCRCNTYEWKHIISGFQDTF